MSRGGRKKREKKSAEIKVSGVHAVEALVHARRDDVLRVLLIKTRLKEFSGLTKWCAEQRRPYQIVSSEEIESFAETKHHEGICVLAKPKSERSLEELLDDLPPKGPLRMLFLDRVENPHNLGALTRVGAHFGVAGVFYTTPTTAALPYTSVARVAEGGAEHVDLIHIPNLSAAIQAMKAKGLVLVATSSHTKRSLYDQPLPPRMVLLLGSERHGLNQQLMKAADRQIQIPGSGAVESLNVATAGAIVLSEHARQKQPSRPSRSRR